MTYLPVFVVTFFGLCAAQESTVQLVPMDKFREPLHLMINVFHSRPRPVPNASQTRTKRDVGLNGFTYPGTKWCGPGSTATHYHDLGHPVGLDMCCRDHDNCEPALVTMDNGLCPTKNLGFRISSCECDDQFKRCLQAQNSLGARVVTELYRTFVRKCYDLDPSTGICDLRHKDF